MRWKVGQRPGFFGHVPARAVSEVDAGAGGYGQEANKHCSTDDCHSKTYPLLSMQVRVASRCGSSDLNIDRIVDPTVALAFRFAGGFTCTWHFFRSAWYFS